MHILGEEINYSLEQENCGLGWQTQESLFPSGSWFSLNCLLQVCIPQLEMLQKGLDPRTCATLSTS